MDTSSATPPELCPWDERRLPREMYVKLAVVHIIVVGAYAHLLHLRRERRSILHYIFAIACPLSVGLFYIVPPLLAIPLLTFRYQSDPERMRKITGLLIGSLPRDDHEPSNLIDDKEDEEDNRSSSATSWRKGLTAQRIRAVAVQLIIMAQCIASIWLFVRRARRGSSALYDERILQLAVLGLCSSTISTLTLLLRPIFPDIHHGNDSRPDRWWTIITGGQNSTESAGFHIRGYRITGLYTAGLEWVCAIATVGSTRLFSTRTPSLTPFSVPKPTALESPLLQYGPMAASGFAVLVVAMAQWKPSKLTQSQWNTMSLIVFTISGTALILMLYTSVADGTYNLILPPFTNGLELKTLLSKPFEPSKYASAIYSEAKSRTWQDLLAVIGGHPTMRERNTLYMYRIGIESGHMVTFLRLFLVRRLGKILKRIIFGGWLDMACYQSSGLKE